jgi:hypothetical protein
MNQQPAGAARADGIDGGAADGDTALGARCSTAMPAESAAQIASYINTYISINDQHLHNHH